MENSLPKSTLLESVEDIKVFVKLSSKKEEESSQNINRRVFFFEENREVLLLQKGAESLAKYKYDYIFSDYENTLLISASIKSTISNLIRSEKNLCFFTFGEEGLGKTDFLFGAGGSISRDSFFKYTTEHIIHSGELLFDNVLIDIFKVNNEKFQIDYRNVAHDMRYDLVDVINQIFEEEHTVQMKKSHSINSEQIKKFSSINSEQIKKFSSNNSGHLIITLKFFKFVTEEDAYKEQREVEIVRTVTFVDVEGFNSSFTESVMNKREDHSLMQFKNMIDHIANQDVEKYSELNSLICSLLSETLKIPNSTFFFFGFVDQNEAAVLESTLTLEIMNSFMKMCPEYFFDKSLLQVTTIKEECHIVETIFSELLFYLEKSKRVNFSPAFYFSLKDKSQQEKYEQLNKYLSESNFLIEEDSDLKGVYGAVSNFFLNRSKWRLLSKALEEILKMNSNFKEETKNKDDLDVNESDELRSVLKNLSKVVKNVEENDKDSIFEKLSEGNNYNIITNIEAIRKTHNFDSPKKNNFKNHNTNSDSKGMKTTVDASSSAESSFIKVLFKEFAKNMQVSARNIYERFTQDPACFCSKGSELYEPINFKTNIQHFQILKAAFREKDARSKLNKSEREASISFKQGMKTTNFKSQNFTAAEVKNKDKTPEVIEPSRNNMHKDIISDIHSIKQSQLKSESIQIFKLESPSVNSKDMKKQMNEHKKTISSLHHSLIDLNVSERISKIDERLSKMHLPQTTPTNIQPNLNSKVKSLNDASSFGDSKIVNQKSFLSFKL